MTTSETPAVGTIRTIDRMDHQPVAMEGVKDASMAILIGKADGAQNFSMRSFRVEQDGHTPRHSHDYEHEVVIIDGSGEVLINGEYRDVAAGDVVFVPADEIHQFKASKGEPLRFLCLVPGTRNCGEPTPGS